MKKIYVNEQWCLGCRLCQYYCAFAQTGGDDIALALKDKKINPAIRVEENGTLTFPISCRHCADPLCVKSCITGALQKVSEGKVIIDKERCIGCYTCVLVCPYGAVLPTEKGVAYKCELCVVPLCAKGCPNGALVFEER